MRLSERARQDPARRGRRARGSGSRRAGGFSCGRLPPAGPRPRTRPGVGSGLACAAWAPERMPSTTRAREGGRGTAGGGLAAAGADDSVVLLGRSLERAHDGGPDRHHPSVARACLGDGPRGRGWNLERLGERKRRVDRRVAGRAQPGRVGERRPADASNVSQREQDLPSTAAARPTASRIRPGARRVDGLHRPERKIVREVGVLDRAPFLVERGPERVVVTIEAQLDQPRRERRVVSHRRAERTKR